MAEKSKTLPPVVTTMRLPPDVLAFASEAAAEQGLSRTQYFLQLVIRDAKRAGKRFTKYEIKPTVDTAASALFD